MIATGIDGPRRARAWGLGSYTLPSGPCDAITDVPGVRVGHATLRAGGPGDDGQPVGRTGVTAVVLHDGPPWRVRLFAASHVLAGYGQLTGRDAIDGHGLLTTPILLTGTRSLGSVYDGALRLALAQDPEACEEDLPIPVVGDCDDSYLSDPAVAAGRREVAQALAAAAAGPVEEGSVGAGTGTQLFGFKGGIGTASRVVRPEAQGPDRTVGVLLLTNFGRPHQLRLPSPLQPAGGRDHLPAGSCIGVVATDAPLHPGQLSRLAARVGFGLVRTGSIGADASGEMFLAVSTAQRLPRRAAGALAARFLVDGQVGPGRAPGLDVLFEATAEATEEAVLNALVAARASDGRRGRRLEAFAAHSPP